MLLLGVSAAASGLESVPVTAFPAAKITPVQDATSNTLMQQLGESLRGVGPALSTAAHAIADALPDWPRVRKRDPKHARELTFRNPANGKTMCQPTFGFDDCICGTSGNPAQQDPDCKAGIVHQGHFSKLCFELDLDPRRPVYLRTEHEMDTFIGPLYPWDPKPSILQGDDDEDDWAMPESDDDKGQPAEPLDKVDLQWYQEVGAIWYMPWQCHRHTPEVLDVVGEPMPLVTCHAPLEDDMQRANEVDEPVDDQGDASCEDSDANGVVDSYEDGKHQDLYVYHMYNQFPLRLSMKGPEQTKRRKAWGQNARRRYTVQLSPRTGKFELFHIRSGGETKKRNANKSIISKVKQKFAKLQEVPKYRESLEIVQEYHNHTHEGHNTVEYRIGKKFFIPNLSAKVLAVSGNHCPICAVHEAIKKKPPEAILTSRRGELVMFDLTKFHVPVHVPPCPPLHAL